MYATLKELLGSRITSLKHESSHNMNMVVVQTLNKQACSPFAWNEKTSRAIVNQILADAYGNVRRAPKPMRDYSQDVVQHITWGEPLQMRLF